MNKDMDKRTEQYLSKVDSYLRHMPVSEKTDILSELKSTFYERQKHGQSADAIISELGSPKELAMSYMGEAVIEKQGFSIRKLMMVIGFYSFASLAWVSIIPTLAILSVAFFFSSVVCVFAGVMGLLKGLVHISLIQNLKIMFLIHEVTGFPALLVGLLLALVFIGLGIICWKAAVGLVRILRSGRDRIDHKGIQSPYEDYALEIQRND